MRTLIRAGLPSSGGGAPAARAPGARLSAPSAVETARKADEYVEWAPGGCPAGSVSGASVRGANGLGGLGGLVFPFCVAVGGETVERNVIIGGPAILLTLPSLLYFPEAVGKPWPERGPRARLSFPLLGRDRSPSSSFHPRIQGSLLWVLIFLE